jgi:hypothetical protein
VSGVEDMVCKMMTDVGFLCWVSRGEMGIEEDKSWM